MNSFSVIAGGRAPIFLAGVLSALFVAEGRRFTHHDQLRVGPEVLRLQGDGNSLELRGDGSIRFLVGEDAPRETVLRALAGGQIAFEHGVNARSRIVFDLSGDHSRIILQSRSVDGEVVGEWKEASSLRSEQAGAVLALRADVDDESAGGVRLGVGTDGGVGMYSYGEAVAVSVGIAPEFSGLRIASKQGGVGAALAMGIPKLDEDQRPRIVDYMEVAGSEVEYTLTDEGFEWRFAAAAVGATDTSTARLCRFIVPRDGMPIIHVDQNSWTLALDGSGNLRAIRVD